jgi:hypothetical protein
MGAIYYGDNLIVSNGTLTVDGVHSFEALLLSLVSRTNLTAGTWESVTNAPSLNGDRKEVLLPANTPAQRFFRLAQ